MEKLFVVPRKGTKAPYICQAIYKGVDAPTPDRAAFRAALAAEYAKRGVRVNCVCPGGVMTPMTQAGFNVEGGIDMTLMARIAPLVPRVGMPAEIAGVVAFLASEEAAYVTGSAYRIDGGQTC